MYFFSNKYFNIHFKYIFFDIHLQICFFFFSRKYVGFARTVRCSSADQPERTSAEVQFRKQGLEVIPLPSFSECTECTFVAPETLQCGWRRFSTRAESEGHMITSFVPLWFHMAPHFHPSRILIGISLYLTSCLADIHIHNIWFLTVDEFPTRLKIFRSVSITNLSKATSQISQDPSRTFAKGKGYGVGRGMSASSLQNQPGRPPCHPTRAFLKMDPTSPPGGPSQPGVGSLPTALLSPRTPIERSKILQPLSRTNNFFENEQV